MAEQDIGKLPITSYEQFDEVDLFVIINNGLAQLLSRKDMERWVKTFAQGVKGDQGVAGVDGTNGTNGLNGVSATHSWSGTTLTITSASGTSSSDLKGQDGLKGDIGESGNSAWTPVLSGETTSEKDVLKVSDWFGGSGNKPEINRYIGISGFVNTFGEAVNIKGQKGVDGADGKDGTNGTNGLDGKDGTNGTNGTNGTDGTDGVDAVGAISKISFNQDNELVVQYNTGTIQKSDPFQYIPQQTTVPITLADGFVVGDGLHKCVEIGGIVYLSISVLSTKEVTDGFIGSIPIEYRPEKSIKLLTFIGDDDVGFIRVDQNIPTPIEVFPSGFTVEFNISYPKVV